MGTQEGHRQGAPRSEMYFFLPFFAMVVLAFVGGLFIAPGAAGVVALLYVAYCAIVYR